ncbi:hypothetical protein [Indiicoccus explosivorum]|uniref:hypothetical protein n=1 Tax=Indiicoccus explosivorum TaxID=1917864 RepID=UPI0013DDB53B|nr:hypothetical protein [Indiicoccus explosivorum]
MKQILFFIFPVICIVLVFLLYNEQLGSIPLLLLSIYLFAVGIRMGLRAKRKSR